MVCTGVNDELVYKIHNHFESALYMAEVLVDIELENFIDEKLQQSCSLKLWRNMMPSKTPKVFSDYQRRYPNYDSQLMSNELEEINCVLSEGQTLIHGGVWWGEKSVDTIRPLSTSFCPQVALRNAEFLGKAYDNSRIDLIVLTVKNHLLKCLFIDKRELIRGMRKRWCFLQELR